ncbi:MAG: class I SAM-dependent methyltransferase [Bacteroidota bacterium]
MSEPTHYNDYISREAQSWGSVRPDPSNPQLWHDEQLFDLFFGKEYRWLINCAVSHGPDVLELGCGDGDLSIMIAKEGCRVTGLDLSSERIGRAVVRAADAGLSGRASYSVADLNQITLPEQAYTCVVAHDSLHHILHLEHLFSEVRKALKPGGTFVVMDYCGMGLLRKILAAGLTAILPTHQPYSMKWQSRRYLRSFLAGEESKRNAISSGGNSTLHPESPFEGVSQLSLIQRLGETFETVRLDTFLPFWFYLAPKVRVGRSLRPAVGRIFRALDNGLSTLGVRGAYFTFEGRNT